MFPCCTTTWDTVPPVCSCPQSLATDFLLWDGVCLNKPSLPGAPSRHTVTLRHYRSGLLYSVSVVGFILNHVCLATFCLCPLTARVPSLSAATTQNVNGHCQNLSWGKIIHGQEPMFCKFLYRIIKGYLFFFFWCFNCSAIFLE